MKIALSVVVALFLIGCSQETSKQKEVQEETQKVEEVKEVKKVEQAKKIEKPVSVKKQEPVLVKETKKPEKTVDGAALYKTSCISCHGAKAEREALSKSQVIQGWESAKIEKALHGYKNKTYGASMKTIMEGKTKNLSDAEIKALAGYISKL